MAWVEAVMRAAFGEEKSARMVEEAARIGAEVKAIWKARRAGRRKSAAGAVDDETVQLPVTPLPAAKPLPARPLLPLEQVGARRSPLPQVDIGVGGPGNAEIDSDDASVYSEHEDEEGGDGVIYNEIEDIIKDYQYMMRRTSMSPRHGFERREESPSALPKPHRAADSRAISYMRDLRANPFKSGVQSLEGGRASTGTRWSRFIEDSKW